MQSSQPAGGALEHGLSYYHTAVGAGALAVSWCTGSSGGQVVQSFSKGVSTAQEIPNKVRKTRISKWTPKAWHKYKGD